MKPTLLPRAFLCAALSCVILLTCGGCARKTQAAPDPTFQVVATTYPVYALASAISAGVDSVDISRLNTGQVSCLHDYTLTVADMRRLEQADLLLLNGAGLEEFLDEVLEQLDTPMTDCSVQIDLMEADEEEHHDHGDGHHHEDDEYDAHYWMDPRNVITMAEEIAHGLSLADPDHAALYQTNAQAVCGVLQDAYTEWADTLSELSHPYLITFHDGFRYFADAFGLDLLFAMEEEDGATASAKDILTASTLVKEYSLPAVFMEANGSGAAARAVSGETGADVAALSMIMDGESAPAGAAAEEILDALYLTPMGQNIETLKEVLK